MRLSGLIRRTLRLGVTDVWSTLYNTINSTTSSKAHQKHKYKHIKIDDEESQFGDDHPPLHPLLTRRTLSHTMRLLLLIPLTILLTLFILAYIIYRPPNLLIKFLQWKNPSVIFHVPLPASQRVIALTLDDAPSSETGAILDLLKAHNAKATFFIIGSQVARYPGVVERIHAEGHELGNHAMTDDPSFQLPLSELERQIGEVETHLPENANRMKYFRPGSGWFNARMKERIERLGYRLVLGGVYPHDPQIARPRLNAWHVLSMVRPGSVVIMHDRRAYSAEQVGLVLKGMDERGFKVESLGGLLTVAEAQKSKKAG
ncbi:carbohydrate esterase family 4 protein [Rhexocercosporidium sp. MPI-PUGE-AT-0058]|nr:carbohydrate esterase family 4 protein [Rhexocercosporidium sp. MPI-PUGE-AT-0058]